MTRISETVGLTLGKSEVDIDICVEIDAYGPDPEVGITGWAFELTTIECLTWNGLKRNPGNDWRFAWIDDVVLGMIHTSEELAEAIIEQATEKALHG